jgi:ribosome recycling factor
MAYDFSSFDTKAAGAKEWLTKEYQALRTGRANPALLDSVQISAYGSLTPLKQVGSVTVEDARTLRVVPWDASLVKEVEKAITAADFGVGVGGDATGVRVTFPELTTERRAEFVKIAKGKLEEARIAVRGARDETRGDILEKEKNGEMGEDDKFAANDELQKKVDSTNNALENMFEAKEDEITNR